MTSFYANFSGIYFYQKENRMEGEGMNEAVEINGIKYKMKQTADTITLQRFNEKHKMWVTLHFPKGNQEEGKRIEDEIIQILSSQYIERNAQIANTPSI